MKHYINLTNGIEAIKDYNLTDYTFIRLQSTACEQKRWNDIILTMSDDLLMSAALGHLCIIYDYGANKKTPRAMWQGLTWLKYVLHRRWYGVEYAPPNSRSANCIPYFRQKYIILSGPAKAKIDYFKKYINVIDPLPNIHIISVTDKTSHDGDIEWYSEILEKGGMLNNE